MSVRGPLLRHRRLAFEVLEDRSVLAVITPVPDPAATAPLAAMLLPAPNATLPTPTTSVLPATSFPTTPVVAPPAPTAVALPTAAPAGITTPPLDAGNVRLALLSSLYSSLDGIDPLLGSSLELTRVGGAGFGLGVRPSGGGQLPQPTTFNPTEESPASDSVASGVNAAPGGTATGAPVQFPETLLAPGPATPGPAPVGPATEGAADRLSTQPPAPVRR